MRCCRGRGADVVEPADILPGARAGSDHGGHAAERRSSSVVPRCLRWSRLLRRTIGPRPGWAVSFVDHRVASVAAPMALRGQAQLAALDARPSTCRSTPRPRSDAPRVTIIAHRRRVAGARRHGGGRRPARELRTDPRRRRGDASGDPSPDVGGSGLGRGRDGQASAEERRALGQRLSPAGGGDPIRLLPDFCFAYGVVRFGLLTEQAHSSATIRARTLWGILSASGITQASSTGR